MGGFLQHISTAFLFVAAGLFIVPSITAPATSLALVQVNFHSGNSTTVTSSVALGAYGFCAYYNGGSKSCSKATIGYKAAESLETANPSGDGYSSISTSSLDKITNTFILHPIAGGITLFAFLISVFSERLGFLAAAFFAGLAWILALAAFALDNVFYAIIRAHLIKHSSDAGLLSLSSYSWGNNGVVWGLGLKLTAGALAALTIGAALSLFSCCCGVGKTLKKQKRRDVEKLAYYPVGEPAGNPFDATGHL